MKISRSIFKESKRPAAQLAVYSMSHFLVDFACAYLLYRALPDTADRPLWLVIYNFCAFALQMPAGLLADVWNHNSLTAAAGCLLVGIAVLCGKPEGVIAAAETSAAAMASAVAMAGIAVTAGIGNALFHVGGGIDVLNQSREKAAPLGIFVSPGALGIYLGTICGKRALVEKPFVLIWMLLAACAVVCCSVRENQGTWSKRLQSENEPLRLCSFASSDKRRYFVIAALTAFFIVVVIRSLLGFLFSFEWKRGIWSLIFTLAVVCGKAGGGVLSDKIGAARTSVLTLTAAVLGFLLSGHPVFGTLGVFFFQMTMPVTLWAAAKLLPGCKGFAFGILTFGLFLGLVPVCLSLEPVIFGTAGYCLFSFVSMVLLLGGLWFMNCAGKERK